MTLGEGKGGLGEGDPGSTPAEGKEKNRNIYRPWPGGAWWKPGGGGAGAPKPFGGGGKKFMGAPDGGRAGKPEGGGGRDWTGGTLGGIPP